MATADDPPEILAEAQVRDAVNRMGVEYKPSIILVIIGGRMYKREEKSFRLLDDKPRMP